MTQQHWNDTAFPEIVSAKSNICLPEYLIAQKHNLDRALASAGAILFRGFDVPTVEDFDAAVEAYGEENFPYKESLSNAVRINLTPRVFTANEAPPETSIFLHHEMAQTPVFPSKLFFYCNIAPEKGGATPLCRSDILLERLESFAPATVNKFADKGVKYTNTFPCMDDPGSGQGRSWKSLLRSETRSDAEARLSSLGYEWAWREKDSLSITSPTLDAVRVLPDGRRVFFNQLIAAFRGWSDDRNDPSKSICYGDEMPVNVEDMSMAIELADELSYDLNWQDGDVALVDNFLVMHGRRPYQGKRKVLASLIK